MSCKPSFGFICWIIGFIVISFAIFWIIIFDPTSVKFHITKASLTQFNLITSNNTLYYKFNVSIIARNPNNNVKVYYRRINAVAWYKDNGFALVSLTPFDQGHKNTTFLGPIVFEGNSVMKLKPKQLEEYKEETRVGIYNDLAVDLDFRIRFKNVGIKSCSLFPTVRCRRLRVPLINSDGELSAPSFNITRCSSRKFFENHRYHYIYYRRRKIIG